MIPKSQKTLLHWIFAALAALLLGQTLSLTAERPRKTATAVLYTGGEPVRVTGTVIRQETVLTFPTAGSWTAAAADGEKVAAGQTLYTQGRARALEQAASRVRLLRTGRAAAEQPLPTQRERLHETIAALNTAEEADRPELAEQLAGLALAESGTEALAAALETAEQRLTLWSGADGETVDAPVPGVFVSTVDGLEAVLTPETPDAVVMLPVKPTDENAAGRIVTGDVWYYRVELPFVPEAGEKLTLELLSGIFGEADMTVETVERTGQGSRVLLSCREYLADAAEIRVLTAKISKDLETGLEIPAGAVYTVEEETGVWCLVGDSPCWKTVTILETLEETVVVELDRSSTDNLWPGDILLLDYQEKRGG